MVGYLYRIVEEGSSGMCEEREKEQLTDQAAVALIHEILARTEDWNADTLDQIAALIGLTGRDVTKW